MFAILLCRTDELQEERNSCLGYNPALLKFYQSRVDVLQSYFLRGQISLAAVFVI